MRFRFLSAVPLCLGLFLFPTVLSSVIPYGGSAIAQGSRSGLKELGIADVKVGKGPLVETGDRVFVTYTGKLSNGKVFDSNDKPDANPFTFILGDARMGVIKGWDVGLRGMKVGGVRKLDIPAEMGYGRQAQGTIPPNSDLYFQVELLDIIKKGEENRLNLLDIKVGSGPAVKEGDRIIVDYVGKLVNGRIIDSTYSKDGAKHGPVEFTVGAKEAIVGIDAGVRGMKVGGKRRIRVTPNLAFGPDGYGSFPVMSIVNYELEVVQIH
jgi:FKBP-type peptidyl-prolyl cis-trans isomerase